MRIRIKGKERCKVAIETVLDFKLEDYEEAAYLLARYFIEHNFEGDVKKSGDIPGGYTTVVSRFGLLKNLIGSRTVLCITFAPKRYEENGEERDGSAIQIEYRAMRDGIVKELLTYLLVLPAVRKLSDYAKILNLSKTKSLEIAEKLRQAETKRLEIAEKLRIADKKSEATDGGLGGGAEK
jgi:hypothetical protein